MAEWLNVRASDGRVVGWQRSSKDEVPPDRDGIVRVAGADKLAAYFEAMRTATNGRVRVKADGTVEPEPDTRPIVRIEASATEIQLGQSVTLTFTVVHPDGRTRTNVNGEFKVPAFGRRFLLTVVNGVASKTVTPKESGLYEAGDTDLYRIETPVTVEVVE